MDSFAQQMLNEIDRRCKEYCQLSNSFINLNAEFKTDQSSDIDIDVETAISKVNESNKPSSKCETIYANSNVIHQNDINNENVANTNSVPVGRKPALPPKPPNPLRLGLPNGYSCVSANRTGKSAKIKIDPAELSLKERLALFEKNKHTTLVPDILGNETESKMSIPGKAAPINVKRKGKSNGYISPPYVPHTSNLRKTIHHQKTIICDIDIDSEDHEASFICESKFDHDIKNQTVSKVNNESIQTPNILTHEVIERREKSSPKMQKNYSTQNTEMSESPEAETHIDGGTNSKENCGLEAVHSKYTHGIRLYGDLTPIVTAIAPSKMNPDETIGLNDLHPSNYSLLSESNQYQPKEEDRWDRFIECLLFFCCVA